MRVRVCVCVFVFVCALFNEGRKNEAKGLGFSFSLLLVPPLCAFWKKMIFFFLLQILKVHAGRKYLPLFLRLSFEIIRKV